MLAALSLIEGIVLVTVAAIPPTIAGTFAWMSARKSRDVGQSMSLQVGEINRAVNSRPQDFPDIYSLVNGIDTKIDRVDRKVDGVSYKADQTKSKLDTLSKSFKDHLEGE
jgi:hypothetical protein